jgi:hypothetical protein
MPRYMLANDTFHHSNGPVREVPRNDVDPLLHKVLSNSRLAVKQHDLGIDPGKVVKNHLVVPTGHLIKLLESHHLANDSG